MPRGTDYEHAEKMQIWLQTWPIDYFFTGTFRENYTPNGARRAAERFFKAHDRKPERAFICIESGDLYGKVHLHGLLCYRDRALFHPADSIWRDWYEYYGRARVEAPQSREDVAGYCTKYCTKSLKDETYMIL